MMRSSAYNRFGVLMGTSWPASCPRWYGLREDSLPMITLFPSQGDFYATAQRRFVIRKAYIVGLFSSVSLHKGSIPMAHARSALRFLWRPQLLNRVLLPSGLEGHPS